MRAHGTDQIDEKIVKPVKSLKKIFYLIQGILNIVLIHPGKKELAVLYPVFVPAVPAQDNTLLKDQAIGFAMRTNENIFTYFFSQSYNPYYLFFNASVPFQMPASCSS
jgi:hypothetical protein